MHDVHDVHASSFPAMGEMPHHRNRHNEEFTTTAKAMGTPTESKIVDFSRHHDSFGKTVQLPANAGRGKRRRRQKSERSLLKSAKH